MHEIEVKSALNDKRAVMQKLTALGVSFTSPATEEDTVYAKEVSSLDSFNRNAEFLRIRVRSDGTTLFTFKYHPTRHEGNPESMPLEYETTIGSKEAMEQILLHQGYKEAVRIRKTRQKGTYNKWEICIDEVEGLGSFMELEEMAPEKESKRIIEEMCAFFAELGIAREDMFADRYDIALLKRR
jgi:adenylate cyclase, class 2